MKRHTEDQTPDNDTSSLDGTRRYLLTLNGVEASDREYARIVNAQPSNHWTEEEIQRDLAVNESRKFRLLR